MAKDTEKNKTPLTPKTPTLPIPLTGDVHDKLIGMQADLQKKQRKRTSLKRIVTDLILKAKI